MFNIRHILQLRGVPRDSSPDFTLVVLALAAPAVFGFSSRCQLARLLANGFRKPRWNTIYSVPRQVVRVIPSRDEPRFRGSPFQCISSHEEEEGLSGPQPMWAPGGSSFDIDMRFSSFHSFPTILLLTIRLLTLMI
jgi:hypothetical protein